jgi:hypothetical protein
MVPIFFHTFKFVTAPRKGGSKNLIIFLYRSEADIEPTFHGLVIN